MNNSPSFPLVCFYMQKTALGVFRYIKGCFLYNFNGFSRFDRVYLTVDIQPNRQKRWIVYRMSVRAIAQALIRLNIVADFNIRNKP